MCAVGGPFSTIAPVGRSVAGSIVSTHTPSNGTARAMIRAARGARELVHVGATMHEPDQILTDPLEDDVAKVVKGVAWR